jgi:fructose-1,6-bisphosphatase I
MFSKLITIDRHILDQQRKFPHATGAFSELMSGIALAAKVIARETTRAGIVDILGAAEHLNVHDEQQQKLDVFADQTIFRMVDHIGRLCLLVSEENEDAIPIPKEFPVGNYILVYDPLDGSTNIDVNGVVGTIWGVYRKVSSAPRGAVEDALQPGIAMAAAGYVIYGPSTMFVYTDGLGVHTFTLDPSVGEFLLTTENLRMPEIGLYYSANQGKEKYWTEGIRSFLHWLQGFDPEHPEPLSARYTGALIADFHRNLMQGGIYFYPGEKVGNRKMNGKLRLLYEALPLAFIAEQAGGYASDGTGNIRHVRPSTLHQRTPFFVGNRYLVEQAERFIAQHDQEWLAQFEMAREMVKR